MKRGRACFVLVFCAATLTSCAPMIPVAAAASYVAGQVAMAYAPDSIKNTPTKGSP